ncbi:MAG TPA: nucleotidyltransferase family protein [Candidatus Polarisedimenticolaceae bacterium]|nr:nucleotidyltransferase family protein [Candidatus Polarisedimenticolaceae bacterium]
MSDTRLAELVLAVVRRNPGDVRRLAARGEVRPAALARACRESDVHPWVHHLLTHDSPRSVGDAAVAALAASRRKVRDDTMLLLAHAERALDALLAAGVVPIALKGLDFLHRLYPRVDLRATDDVDLLIRRRDLKLALDALRGVGWLLPAHDKATHYVRSSHHLPLHSPGALRVDLELHWNLAQERRYTIDPDGLFDRALPLDVAGRSILRLGDEDIVAHLLIHHFSHYFDRRLKWLVDLQRVEEARPIDWPAVARRLREWSGTAAAGISLMHLRKLDPALIPPHAVAELDVAGWRRVLTWPLRSSHPLELFRGTRRRRTQLYLAAVMIEHPSQLPGWLRHRARRGDDPADNPLDDHSRSAMTG